MDVFWKALELDVPKSIADCFKYRSAIGLDVALEALKKVWIAQKLDLNLLAKSAQICRVQRIIQPYLEMLVRRGWSERQLNYCII